MKKILFLAIFFAFATGSLSAQSTIVEKPIKNTQTLKSNTAPAPVPAPPPPTTSKTTAPIAKTDMPASVYSLTSVRVDIRTGNDNKEFPSNVYVTLLAKSTPENWRNYLQFNLSNEMKINSDCEFGLDLEGRAPTPLETFQQSGLKLTIKYEPNFFADAWKIEKVSLVLEFKDQFGNLHPTLGSKTIVFNNAYGFLNNEYKNLDCVTDASFAPLTAVIRK